MNKTIAGFILVVTVITILLFIEDKETFDSPAEVVRDPQDPQESFPDSTFYLDDTNTSLSSGTIVKYKTKELFHYEYLFNLPVLGSDFHQITQGGEFNSPREIGTYKVFAGEVTDGKTLKLIGVLERHGDGWHKLYFSSSKNYVKTCVVYDNEVIHCAEL